MFSRWRRFWFHPSGPASLGVCRILFFGSFFLFYLPVDFGLWGEVSRVFWMPTPLFRLLRWEPMGPDALRLLQILWKAALLLACVGFWTRASTWVSFLGGLYLLGLPHCFGKTHHFDAVVVLILGVLAVSRCGDGWSVDRLFSPRNPETEDRLRSAARAGEYGWPIQAARVLLAAVFFSAGVAKLRESGLSWVLSDNMKILLVQYRYHLANADPLLPWGPWIAQHIPWAARGFGAAALAIETGYPLALFSRRARLLILPGAIGMLIGIRLFMGPTFYPFILCHLFWVPWERVGSGIRARWGGRKRASVLFDGSCGLCRGVVERLSALDLFGRMELLDVAGEWASIRSRFPSLKQEACLADMHLVRADGSVAMGFSAYRAIAWVLPLGWLALPFLYLPGVAWVGRRIYSRVASERHRGECALPRETREGGFA